MPLIDQLEVFASDTERAMKDRPHNLDHLKSVAIWLRVSTEMQAASDAPEHHERRARLYAEAKGWDVREVYRLDAVSGKSVMDHPETKRMLGDVRKGRITGLIFSKLARLARNTRELLEFADIFRAHGADLISLDESLDTSSPAGRLLFMMIGALAEFEREEIASRVRASVPIRAKLGKPLGGSAPYGYHWVEGKLVPHPEEAPIRRLMYELYREHKRKRTVARILNERGYRARTKSGFSMTTVNRVLADPTAKGVRIANRYRNQGKHRPIAEKPQEDWVYHQVEPIVSEELWDECNALLTASRKNHKKPTKKPMHLFAGYAFCACGGKMYVTSSSKTRYTCAACRKGKIPIIDLEGVYHEQLRQFALEPDELRKHVETAHEALHEKERLLSVMQREYEKLKEEEDSLFSLYQAKQLDAEGFGRRYQPLKERLRQLDDELPAIRASIDVMKINQLSEEEVRSAASNLYDRWPKLPFEERRQIVEAITEKIVIGEQDIDISFLHVPPSQTAANGHRTHTGSPPPTSLPWPSRAIPTSMRRSDGISRRRQVRAATSSTSLRLLSWAVSGRRRWCVRSATSVTSRCRVVRKISWPVSPPGRRSGRR
ncbi:MAG: recombinase family protein [Reyranellaceae bacterium]